MRNFAKSAPMTKFTKHTAFFFAHGITKKAGAALLCALLILSALWSCASGPVTTKPRIVVSIQPQKYMLEQIAGRKWDVICLLPDGVATTGFDATITHLTNISGCKAYFMIGNISLEHAINGIVRNTYPSLKLYDNSEGLSLITPANGSQPDPYTWNSVKNAKVIAHNMYRSLSEMDPDNEGYYRRRLTRFMHRLDTLDTEIKTAIDMSKKQVFISEKSELSYFARDYGLRQINTLPSGHSADSVAKVSVNLYSQQWPDAMRSVAEAITGSTIVTGN